MARPTELKGAKIFRFFLEEADYKKLKHDAEVMSMSVSALVRKIIKDYLI